MLPSLANGADAPGTPIQLSFPLPNAPLTSIYLFLTIQSTHLLLFLTSTASDSPSAGPTPMGSFVYAMPSRTSSSSVPLSTPLYTHTPTLDFATRLARLLARKSDRPTYVGNSISFAGAGLGGTVEEEMRGFGRVVEVVLAEIRKREAARAVGGDTEAGVEEGMQGLNVT